jgi:hypothetical protein
MRICSVRMLLLPVIMTAIYSVPAFWSESGTVDAFEIARGAALRQNVLLMKQPSGPGAIFSGDSFGISETRARLWTSTYLGSGQINGAVEIRGSFNSLGKGMFSIFQNEGSLPGQGSPLKRWDMTINHIDDTSVSLSTRIDRLDFRWSMGRYDLDIGRQPISLGTSHFIGVLDVIAPFAPGDLDATYKPGVDAVRLRRGIGMTGEAEIIGVGAKEWGKGALLGRLRSSFKGVDLEFVGGRFRERYFGGFGWEGGLRSFGIWGEAALFERKKDREEVRGGWSDAAFSGVAGIDYSIADNTIIGGALMYQDFGVRDPEDLHSLQNEAPYSEGWVFLGSCAYGVITFHRQLHPLVNGDIAGLINLVDNSTLWQPRITVSTGDNTDIAFYGWIGAGKKTEGEGLTFKTRSEFGMLPDGGGFYARWFF